MKGCIIVLYDFIATKFRREDGNIIWILNSNQLKGCVSQGFTIDQSIVSLEQNEEDWIDTAKLYDISIPEVLI